MSPTIDPLRLSGVISFVNETLTLIVYAVGFVAALRRWADRGRSARSAAAGFGIGLLGDFGGHALTLLNAWYLAPTAALGADYESYLWPMLVATSLRSFTRPASVSLILLALWFAWRDSDRVHRDPVT